MADRPVDDILADLLALEEEVSGAPQIAAAAASAWDEDALLADHTRAAASAADAALLADCDALLADVDLLLSDFTSTAQSVPRAAAPRPAAQARRAAAEAAPASSTAAVLSECDALLADADLLLGADDFEDQPSLNPASPAPPAPAVAVPVAPAPAAVPAPAPHTEPAAAGSTAHGEVPAAPSAAAEAATPAADSMLGLMGPAQPGTVSFLQSAAAAEAGDAAAGQGVPAVSGTGQQSQQADVDMLLLDLLTPAAEPSSTAAAGAGSMSAVRPAFDQPQQQQAQQQPVQQQAQQQQQQQQQQQDQPLQQAQAASSLPLPPDPQQHGEHAPGGGQSSSSSSEDRSSSEDFLGDMLHDMAKVLEVDEDAIGAQQLPLSHSPAAATAEAPAAATRLDPVAVASSAGAGRSVQMPAASSSWISQQQQQQWGLQGSAGLSDVSRSLTGGGAMLWQQTLSAAGAAEAAGGSSGEVPLHELALQQAWAQEEALVHGDLTDSPPDSPTAAGAVEVGDSQQASSSQADREQQQQRKKRRRLAPLSRLQELLSDALSDWNPAGRPDASGTAMIGGSVLLCLESLAGLFAAGAAAAGAGTAPGVDWAQVLSAALAPHGQLQVVAASGQYLAVGAASGSALVFQLPVSQPAAGGQGAGTAPQHPPSHSTGSGHSPLPGGAAMWQLGHSAGERGALGYDPVTSLGFSTVGAARDALWLAVGHASGSLSVWELQKRGPRQVAVIAQHSSRLTFTTFMPGGGTSLLLSGDVRGRCCMHTFSASLLRTNVATRVLIAGEYGPLLSIAHLAPFGLRPAALPAGAVRGAEGPDGVEWPEAAIWQMLCEDGAWRVGEGVCCLTTPTHTYIARVKPSSGDLVMLFSIPQPQPGTQQQAVPVAAWLPHSRQKAGGHSRVSGDTLMPVGVLALGWGSRLVLFEVPLVGDQITAGEVAAVAVTASTAAAAAQQAKRTQQPSAVAAAAASRLWQQRTHAALDSLTPEAAIAVATRFPLSTCASWTGGQPPQGSQGSGPGHSGDLAGMDLQQHQLQMGPPEPLPILGVHWLDADAVAVVCDQGYSSLLLVLALTSSSSSGDSSEQQQLSGSRPPATLQVYEQVEWMDQPVDRSWGSAGAGAGGLTSWGGDCGGSVVGSGARMYLLGQQGGMFCGRLMPWSERLKTLQDVRKHKLGLYFALRFYLTLQRQQQHQQQAHSSSGGSLMARPSVGGFGRSEGVGAEPQQLQQWLLSLVLGHASATLSDAADGGSGSPVPAGAATAAAEDAVPQAVATAAEACVCVCLLLSRTDVLFGRVFQLFAQQGVVPSALGALVETVELAVLSDLLQGLAPEVMQALVEHFDRKGQPGRVEACVVHLPIMSLDLNQVIRLCEGSGLYSALTHIYNQMNDFRKPLLDLLANVAAAPSWPAAQAAAYKLLVYLRCCFRGLAFPPGTGSLPTDPHGVRDVIQATLLGSLLFLDRADLLREWQQSGGAAAAVAAVAAAGPDQTAGLVLPALCDPHPGLQLLLAVDVPATITVLAEATAGWDAVDTDLRAAAGKPSAEQVSVLVATQVVVNAFVALLEAGRFQQWQQAHSSRPAAAAAGSSRSMDGEGGSSSSVAQSGAEVAMDYIMQLLAAGRVTVQPSFVIKLLQHLVNQATAATAAAAAGDAQSQGLSPEQGGSSSSAAAPATTAAAFEQQFISIVQVVGVQAAAGAEGRQPGQPLPGDPAAFSPAQAKEVLQLAKRCNFVAAAATVHHLQGNYAAALSCYLALVEQQQARSQQEPPQQQQRDGLSSADSRQGSRAVFGYIGSFLSGSGSHPQARQAFLSCVCQQVVPLIQLDPSATAGLLLQHMPEQQVPVLLSLQASPELQFRFLRAAMQQNQAAQQRQSGPGSAAAAAATAGAAAGVESLLERPEVAILYVKLLARFDPSAVLPFLQSHHNYSVAEAIQVCRAAGVCDGEAFLLERMGDLDAALRLYLSTTRRANSALQAAVLGGSVPLLLLPPGYWVPGWFDRRSTAATRAFSSSSRDQSCFGMEQLVQQLECVAHMAAQASGSRNGGGTTQSAAAAAPGAVQQASEQLLAAAANVAATLLQQLDPSCAIDGSSKQPSRGPPIPGSSLSGSLDEVTGPGAAALQLPPPMIDLYKSWMAELSPRLRLKGLGAGVGTTVGHFPGSTALLTAAGSSCGSSSSSMAGVHIPAVPAQLQAAWQALQAAVAFCQRNTRPSSSTPASSSAAAAGGSSSSSVAANAAQELWFQLMDVYVANLRSLHAHQQHQQQLGNAGQEAATQQQQQQHQQHGHLPKQQQERLVADLTRAASGQAPLQELPSVLRAGAAAVAAGQVLPGLLRLLLDEVVCSMADCLPLLDIVGRIIQQHGNERFGEFRSTLLGLFGATGYDSAIMAAANRLITGDAFTAVRHAYGLRQLARAIRAQQQQDAAVSAGAAVGATSSSASMLPAPQGAPAAAVQSAVLLGVLGPGSYDSGVSSSTRISSSRYSLSQADRDLIQGILGAGGMRLQLQPAGPVLGAGVTAAYKAAAQAVADTGRVFQGEIDLALELAMLQSLQEHQQHQRRQQPVGAPGQGWAGGWGFQHADSAVGQRLLQQQQIEEQEAHAREGRATASTSSFDIDELLTWSATNM